MAYGLLVMVMIIGYFVYFEEGKGKGEEEVKQKYLFTD